MSIKATAKLVSDFEGVHAMQLAVLRRNTPEIPEEALEKISAGMASKKTGILIELPKKVISWDHGKLGGTY